MRKKTLRMISSIMTLVFLVSMFQAPTAVEAAKTATIPVKVGSEVINVTPGQWVTVNTPGGQTSYNVRFVDGKPVALEMNQYTQLLFGDAATAGSTGTTAQPSTGSTSKPSTGSTSKPTTGNNNTGVAGTSTPGSVDPTASTGTTAKPSTGSTAKPSTGTSKPTTNTGAAQTTNTGAAQTTNTGAAQTTNTGAAQTTNTGAAQTTNAGATQAPAPQTSVADASGATAGSTSTTAAKPAKAWDPARHPRDPQTGRFISHEEAIARGLMDPADANISSSGSNSSSTQTASAEGAAQTSTPAADTQTAPAGEGAAAAAEGTAAAAEGTAVAATSGDAAQAAGETSSKPSIGDKFKAGYETGKNLTNQGFQNVKDSLKSGFSAKNILVTAGITVGVDLATQIMRGEKPSLKSAISTVCCAEFVGSVGGSVLGSAAGSFFVPFLSAIPVVGGALSALAPVFGSVVGSSVGAYVAGDLKNGRFSIKEAFKRIDWVGVTGQTIGSTLGAALGSCLGPVGTVIGGMAGGYLGNWAAHKIAGLFGKGEAELPTIAMPTGSTGGSTVAGIVTLGGDNVTGVTVSNDVPVVVADNSDDDNRDGMTGDDIDAEINAAYEEYTDYYSEYSQLIQAGKQAEALKVAQKMNKAKAKYDELRKKG